MQQNLSDQTFAAACNPLYINSNLLQSSCLQGLSLNDVQDLQQQQYQLAGLNLQNVMLNQQQQQGLIMNQPASIVGQQPNLMLLNQQNLLLNQQANPLSLYTQNQINQLIQPGQQMLLTNLYSLNKNQLPVVMAANLIPSPFLNQTSKQKKNSKKKKDNTSFKKNVLEDNQEILKLNKRVEEEKNNEEMSESEEDDERDIEENHTDLSDGAESDENFEMFDNDKQEESDDNKSIESNNDEDSEDDFEEMTHDLSFDEMESSTNDYSSNLNENTNSSCSINSKQMINQIPDLRHVKKEPKSPLKDIDFDKLSDEELQPFLNEIKTFARKFKLFRSANDMTQQEVSAEISKFMRCSQSKLCRFEKYHSNQNDLKIHKKKIKAVLQTKDALEKYIMYKENNLNQPKDINDKIRKKRINFKSDQVKILNDFFNKNSHPSPEQIAELSKQTNHSEKEIKVWFNNKKAALRSAAKQSEQAS